VELTNAVLVCWPTAVDEASVRDEHPIETTATTSNAANSEGKKARVETGFNRSNHHKPYPRYRDRQNPFLIFTLREL
jgi:hypothetical protein